MRRIVEFVDTGHTATEIGRAIGRSVVRVRAFAAARGVFISRSETVVGFAVR